MATLLENYNNHKEKIVRRLEEFKSLAQKNYFYEMIFCILTPASGAQRCWDGVLEIKKLKSLDEKSVKEILRRRTRFHNRKTIYVLEAGEKWREILPTLENSDRLSLRNWLAENVRGFGMKEASHFLRNIGKSDNQVAILDRHILRNLKSNGVIDDENVKSRKQYLEIEAKFLEFSAIIGIPIDHLDLLWWSQENGELFK